MQRAALEAMFALSSEDVAVENEVDYSEEQAVAAAAEAEAAELQARIAEIDLRIAELQSGGGGGVSAEEAARKADEARAVLAKAAATEAAASEVGIQAKRERAAAKATIAEQAVRQATEAQRAVAALEAEAEQAAESAAVAVSRLEASAFSAADAADGLEGVPYPSAIRGASGRDPDDLWERLLTVERSNFGGVVQGRLSRLESDRARTKQRLSVSIFGLFGAAAGGFGGFKAKEFEWQRQARERTARIEAAEALGLADPWRASAEDIAAAAAEARAEEEAKL